MVISRQIVTDLPCTRESCDEILNFLVEQYFKASSSQSS